MSFVSSRPQLAMPFSQSGSLTDKPARLKIPWRNYTKDPRWKPSAEAFWSFLTRELCHSDDPTILREGYVKITFADGRPSVVFIVYADTPAESVKTHDGNTEFTVRTVKGAMRTFLFTDIRKLESAQLAKPVAERREDAATSPKGSTAAAQAHSPTSSFPPKTSAGSWQHPVSVHEDMGVAHAAGMLLSTLLSRTRSLDAHTYTDALYTRTRPLDTHTHTAAPYTRSGSLDTGPRGDVYAGTQTHDRGGGYDAEVSSSSMSPYRHASTTTSRSLPPPPPPSPPPSSAVPLTRLQREWMLQQRGSGGAGVRRDAGGDGWGDVRGGGGGGGVFDVRELLRLGGGSSDAFAAISAALLRRASDAQADTSFPLAPQQYLAPTARPSPPQARAHTHDLARPLDPSQAHHSPSYTRTRTQPPSPPPRPPPPEWFNDAFESARGELNAHKRARVCASTRPAASASYKTTTDNDTTYIRPRAHTLNDSNNNTDAWYERRPSVDAYTSASMPSSTSAADTHPHARTHPHTRTPTHRDHDQYTHTYTHARREEQSGNEREGDDGLGPWKRPRRDEGDGDGADVLRRAFDSRYDDVTRVYDHDHDYRQRRPPMGYPL